MLGASFDKLRMNRGWVRMLGASCDKLRMNRGAGFLCWGAGGLFCGGVDPAGGAVRMLDVGLGRCFVGGIGGIFCWGFWRRGIGIWGDFRIFLMTLGMRLGWVRGGWVGDGVAGMA